MKVSVVTISYNQATFLEQAIISVIEQDYRDIEYIIVDPGSKDYSRQIIQKYSAHFSHQVLEPDRGPADGLNKGFLLAKGDIFGVLNADDLLISGAIRKVAEYFKKNPKADVVSGHSIIIDHRNRKLRISYSDKFSPIMYAYGAAELMQPSTFFKKSCYIDTGGYNIDNNSNWDSELFVEMSLNGAKFRLINEFLSCYRLHPDSITLSKRLDQNIKNYNKLRFRKLRGREMDKVDINLRLFFIMLKYTKNPLAFIERLAKGKIYGRKTY